MISLERERKRERERVDRGNRESELLSTLVVSLISVMVPNIQTDYSMCCRCYIKACY